MHGLARERMVVAVRSMAIAEAALEQTVAYTKDRKAFGQRIFDFQNTQFKLAELATACTTLRPFVDRSIQLLAEDELSAELAAMAKLASTELADRVLDELPAASRPATATCGRLRLPGPGRTPASTGSTPAPMKS